MKNLFYLLLFLLHFPTYAQKLSHRELLEDLIQLKKEIGTYNPALKIYNPGFAKKSDKLLSSLPTDSVSLVDCYKYLSRLSALSNEGHFSLGSWSDTVHSGFLKDRYKYMPLSVKVIEDKMFVWIDNSNEQRMKRGEEILQINGLKTDSILNLIYEAFPSDGQITTYVNRKIEMGFSWLYYFYVAQPAFFRITTKNTTGDTREVSITALTRETQFENYDKYFPESKRKSNNENEGFYTLKHDKGVSYLTLPSFDFRLIDQYGVKAEKLYKSIFTEIANEQSQYLVIDLRENTGGRNEFADEMVPYINKGKEDPFLKKTISWKGKEKIYKLPKTSKLAFQGKVYVLVDGRTYSAGSTLARYLKEYANAVVIGEETGTRYEGFAAGSSQDIIFISSQLRIGIPRYHILFPKSEMQTTSNRGLLPDKIITPSIEDLINGKDLQMNKARELIHAGSN